MRLVNEQDAYRGGIGDTWRVRREMSDELTNQGISHDMHEMPLSRVAEAMHREQANQLTGQVGEHLVDVGCRALAAQGGHRFGMQQLAALAVAGRLLLGVWHC